jgi:2-(3-amino-3-carboxypropyl)histidine synthase
MRVHHIPVRRNFPVQFPAELLEKLPDELCLCTTAQFLHQLPQMKEALEKTGRKISLYQPRHTQHPGQVLGCSTDTIAAPAFLFVGEGLFHPQALAYANEAPVHLYDPVSEKIGMIDRSEIERRQQKRQAGIKTFYTVKHVGVLLSTKSGQKDTIAVQKLREQYPDKVFYTFLGNTIDLAELENFPFIDIWLNTACPRIGYDDIYKTEKPLINAEDVLTAHRF